MKQNEQLHQFRECWAAKPLLKEIYGDFYDRILRICVPGRTLEIGGGIGMLKVRLPAVITTDIQFGPWLDCVADAQRLPFKDEAISNIVMVDVLHHLEYPLLFFKEAARVLRCGGQVVMVEPAITPGSAVFYRFFHHEPVQMSADPLAEGVPKAERDPYEANQAIPTLIATRDRERFNKVAGPLRIIEVRWFALAAYPLSGGFKSWSLIPKAAVRRLLRLEHAIEPMLGRLIGFRLMLVIEKVGLTTNRFLEK